MRSVKGLTTAVLIIGTAAGAWYVYPAFDRSKEQGPRQSVLLHAQKKLPMGMRALPGSQAREGSADEVADLMRSVGELDFNRDASTVHADFQQLERLLHEHPERLPLVSEQIQALTPEMPFFMERVSFFSGILAGSTAPQAEPLLVDLLTSSKHETVAIQVVAALGDLPHPTAAGGKALLAAHRADESPVVRDMALLAYGSMAAQLRGQDVVGPLDETLATLAMAAPPGERLAYLAAIGNSGAAAYLPIIEPYLMNSDPLIRARAVYELRKIPGERALGLMKKARDGDPEPGVRAEAEKALAQRPRGP